MRDHIFHPGRLLSAIVQNIWPDRDGRVSRFKLRLGYVVGLGASIAGSLPKSHVRVSLVEDIFRNRNERSIWYSINNIRAKFSSPPSLYYGHPLLLEYATNRFYVPYICPYKFRIFHVPQPVSGGAMLHPLGCINFTIFYQRTPETAHEAVKETWRGIINAYVFILLGGRSGPFSACRFSSRGNSLLCSSLTNQNSGDSLSSASLPYGFHVLSASDFPAGGAKSRARADRTTSDQPLPFVLCGVRGGMGVRLRSWPAPFTAAVSEAPQWPAA